MQSFSQERSRSSHGTRGKEATLRRFVEEAINKKNLDALDGLVAENFVEHVPFRGQGPGRDGLRQALSVFLSAFPDIHGIVDKQIAEGKR